MDYYVKQWTTRIVCGQSKETGSFIVRWTLGSVLKIFIYDSSKKYGSLKYKYEL